SANAPPAQLPPAAPAQQPQMVAPPDQINDRAPDHTRFESDRDNTVLKETVNPGVPHPAAPVPAQAPQPPQAPHKAEAARDIQRGDVTLLNTKANVFAPFVRRIGERVFQHLILRQRALQLQQILTAHDVVEMRVVLDRGGKLKSVRVDNHSGSASMDDTLSEAINTAAFDNNPPPAAANATGEYEFVFAAQLRTFEPGQGGTPSRIESAQLRREDELEIGRAHV